MFNVRLSIAGLLSAAMIGLLIPGEGAAQTLRKFGNPKPLNPNAGNSNSGFQSSVAPAQTQYDNAVLNQITTRSLVDGMVNNQRTTPNYPTFPNAFYPNGVPMNPYQMNPYQVNPYQVNPYQVNPYQMNPYQMNPFQTNIYQPNPWQMNPYQTNPFQQNPFANPFQTNPWQANPFQQNQFGNPVLGGPGAFGPGGSGLPPLGVGN